MLNELKTNLEAIYQEKQQKVIPENIKKGVTMFGVEGELASMPYIEDTVVENIVFSNPTSSTYTFTLNANGYYESNNKGVNSSFAMGRFTFNVTKPATISVDVINYAEGGCDYGIIGKIDQTLNASTSTDSGAISLSNKNKADVQTIELGNATVGTHFIDFKFRKDGSVHNYNDSLQIKLNTGAKIYINYPVYSSQEELLADTEQPQDTIAVIVDSNLKVLTVWKWTGTTWSQVQNAFSNIRWYETQNAFTSDTLNRSSINPYYGIIGKQNVLSPYYDGRNYTNNDLYVKKQVVFDTAITNTFEINNTDTGGGSESHSIKGIKLTPTTFTFEYGQYVNNYHDEEYDINRSGMHYIILNYTSSDGLTYTYNNAQHYYYLYGLSTGGTEYPEKTTEKEAYTDQIQTQTIDDIEYFVIANTYNYHHDSTIIWYDEFSAFMFKHQNTLEKILTSKNSSSYSTYSDDLYGDKSKMAECKVYANGSVIEGTLDKPLQYTPYGWDPGRGDLENPQAKIEIYQRLKELLNSDELYENYTGDNTISVDFRNYKYSEIPTFKFGEKVSSFYINSCPNITTLPDMNYRNVTKVSIDSCENFTTLPNTALSTITDLLIANLPNINIGNVDLSSLTTLGIDNYQNTSMSLDFTNANMPNLVTMNLSKYSNIPVGINSDDIENLELNSCENFSFDNLSFSKLKSLSLNGHEGVMNISSWGNLDTTQLESIYVESFNGNIPEITISSTLKSLTYSNINTTISIPTGDYSGVTKLLIGSCRGLTTIGNLNTSSLTELDTNGKADPDTGKWIPGNGITDNSNLVTIEGLDTSNVTRINRGFSSNSKLTNIPVFDLSSTEYINYMFGNCPSLSDESLNNVLASILTIPSTYTGGKSLSSQFGLSSSQIAKAKTLSNWAAVSALGWS